MTISPVIDAGDSRRGAWLRTRRVRLALIIALFESIVILLSNTGWFVVVGLAAAAVALYYFVGRESRFRILRDATWIAAASQLVVVLVPVLWLLVTWVAILVLVVMAVALLALLLLDRR